MAIEHKCDKGSFVSLNKGCSSVLDRMILSRLVDSISSRILHPMLLLVENHSIAVVLPLGEVLHSLNRFSGYSSS